jgi:glucose/mannose transport system permease protein
MTGLPEAIGRAATVERVEEQRSLFSSSALRWVLFGVAVIVAAFYLLPIILLVLTGLKSYDEVNLYEMWSLPRTLSFQSFIDAWQGSPSFAGLGQNFINSFIVTIPATLLSSLLGAMNGYVLSKWQFRGANIIFGLLLFGLFIPYQSILIPLVRTLNAIGLYGSLPGLIFVHVVYGIPITTLIFRNYFATVPNELLEAAQMDGAHFFDLFTRIMVPIAAPAFVVAIIWQFTNIWNDFLFALTVTSSPASQPVTVALNNLAGSFSVEWNVQFAGALIAALPTLLVYIFLGRYFVRGLLAGSVKG